MNSRSWWITVDPSVTMSGRLLVSVALPSACCIVIICVGVAGLYRVFAYEMPAVGNVVPEHTMLRPQYSLRHDVPAYATHATPADIIDLKNVKLPVPSFGPLATTSTAFDTPAGFGEDFVPSYGGDDDQDMPSYGVE
jgi:hypothetical protein